VFCSLGIVLDDGLLSGRLTALDLGTRPELFSAILYNK